MDVEVVESVSSNEEPQNHANCNASSGCTCTSSNEASNLVNCNCVILPPGSGRSSDTKSVSSDSSSAVSSITVSGPLPNAQQICCLKQRFSSVFNNEYLSDVMFIVGQGELKETIPAHRVTLAVGSAVFQAMFSKNWSSESSTVEIPDLEPFAFKAVLRFLYMDEIALTPDTVVGILFAARKYAVLPLENSCIDFLIQNVSPENAFTVLKAGKVLDIQKLVDSCLETIDKNTQAVVDDGGFLDTDVDTLCSILSRNSLTIKEVRLFEALVRWSEAECSRKDLPINLENQQLVSKTALPLIRFSLMSSTEFSSKVAHTNLLSNKELIRLYQFFVDGQKPLDSVNFNETPRFYNEFIVNRFEDFKSGTFCNGLRDSILFTSDTDVQLLGYGMYGSRSTSGSAEYTVKIRLLNTVTGICLGEYSGVHKIGNEITFLVFFQNPIRLSASKKYTASVNIKGPNCIQGINGQQKVSVDLPHDQKVTFSFETDFNERVPFPRTTVNEGIIPQLIFTL